MGNIKEIKGGGVEEGGGLPPCIFVCFPMIFLCCPRKNSGVLRSFSQLFLRFPSFSQLFRCFLVRIFLVFGSCFRSFSQLFLRFPIFPSPRSPQYFIVGSYNESLPQTIVHDRRMQSAVYVDIGCDLKQHMFQALDWLFANHLMGLGWAGDRGLQKAFKHIYFASLSATFCIFDCDRLLITVPFAF